MKQADKLRAGWIGFADAINRFPVTMLLLAGAAISNTVYVNAQNSGLGRKLMIGFIMGASLYTVLQLLYERFFINSAIRVLNLAVSILAGFVYFILVRNAGWNPEVTIRTAVIFFLLLVAFLWAPVIKNNADFNESFMSAFKAFFIAAFFTGVLFAGVSLIIMATNMLIIRINSQAYEHAANIIFIIIAPLYFLSLIPYYQGKKDRICESPSDSIEAESTPSLMQERKEEFRKKAASPSKFLETLISYVIIPITAVFTIILLLYIILNMTGRFWTDNLMEPLLVAYSITVIIVYILAGRVTNSFALWFRKIFPKILVPVVLFQTLSSVLRIGEAGITYGRYYVILFGLFATTAGILFCFIPIRKNGIIAPIVMILALISIVPPVDAFTVSRLNQTARLENTLKRNQMLSGNTIVPNKNVSKEDREIIRTSFHYLSNMRYTRRIGWLSSYQDTSDFAAAFGFPEYEGAENEYKNVYISRDMQMVPIAGYDYFLHINQVKQSGTIPIGSFRKNGADYKLEHDFTGKEQWNIVLYDNTERELLKLDVNEFLTGFLDSEQGKAVESTQNMTFTKENDQAVLTLVADSIYLSDWENGGDRQVDAYLFVKIK